MGLSLDRTSGYVFMMGLNSALKNGISLQLSDFALPSNHMVRPLGLHEIRFQDPISGKFLILDERTGALLPEMPERMRLLCLYPDREGSGWAALHFLADELGLVLEFQADQAF